MFIASRVFPLYHRQQSMLGFPLNIKASLDLTLSMSHRLPRTFICCLWRSQSERSKINNTFIIRITISSLQYHSVFCVTACFVVVLSSCRGRCPCPDVCRSLFCLCCIFLPCTIWNFHPFEIFCDCWFKKKTLRKHFVLIFEIFHTVHLATFHLIPPISAHHLTHTGQW